MPATLALIPWWFKAFVLFAVSQALKPKVPGIKGDEEPGIKSNLRSSTAILPVIYGEMKVGGNDVFIEATGTDNKELWIVQTLAEGECNTLVSVTLDGKDPSVYGGNVEYWFHSGSSTQTVDTNLNSAIPKWTDNLRNTCYIVWHFTFDRNYFQGVPERLVTLQGKILYDYRDLSTAYSTNIALALYDYLINTRYGMGVSSAKIDVDSWTSIANYCDTKGWDINHVLPNSGGKDIIDQLSSLFRGQIVYFNDTLFGRYADLNYETSLMTISDEHIVQQGNGKSSIKIAQPGKYSKPDGLVAWYIDPNKNYSEDSIQVGESQGSVEEIKLYGATDRTHISSLAVYNLERRQLDRLISGAFRDDCQKLDPHDVVTFNSTSLNISDQLCRVESAIITPDGLVNLSLRYEDTTLYNDNYDLETENVYTCVLPDKDMEVPSVSNVTVTEELYSTRLVSQTRVKVSFSVPTTYPWFSHVEVWLSNDDITYTHQFPTDSDFYIEPVKEGDSLYIRLKTVSIHGRKTTDVNDYKYYYLVTGQASVPDSLGSLEAIVNQNTINLYSARIESDDIELYEFRLGTTWASGLFLASLRSPNLSLVGVKPGSHGFMANTLSTNGQYGDTPVSKSATLIDPPDGWSVTNTETCDYNGVAIEGMSNANPCVVTWTGHGLNDGSPVTFVGITQSNWTVLNGNAYTITYLTVDTFSIAVDSSTFGSYVPGTDPGIVYIGSHDNTEYLSYSGSDYLQCSHNGGVLVGTYLSPIYDRGAVDRYMVYCLADAVVTGTGTTWDDQIPLTLTGSELLTDGDFSNYTADDLDSWTESNCDAAEDVSGETGSAAQITLSADGGYIYQSASVTAGNWYKLSFYYKNTASDVAMFGVYDSTNSAWITPDGVIELGNNTDFTYYSYLFEAPTGCASVEIQFGGVNNTDIVWFDTASLKQIDTSASVTWADISASSKTWNQIFALAAAPQVKISLYYGDTSPPTSKVERLEILSAIVSGRYFQVEIEITDPSAEIYALVENFTLKFAQ